MYKLAFRLLFASFVLLSQGTAWATCRSTLHYVNGVMNENRKEIEKITETMRKVLDNDPDICVGEPLFNPSQKLLMDLAETYKLKLDNTKSFWEQIRTGLIAGVLEAFHNMIAVLSGKEADIYNHKEEIASMYEKLKPELVAGNGHVLVAHSEGNLFAVELQKMAIADGYPSSRIAIMHVASPIKVDLSLLRTTTILSTYDSVIKLIVGTNKPNFEPDKTEQPHLGHGMLAVYLNSENTGTFTDFTCEKVLTTPLAEIIASIKKAARCQFGPCLAIGFTTGEC